MLPPVPLPHDQTLWELLIKAGWVMIPLFGISFVAVVLIFYYFVALRKSRVSTEKFKNSMESMIRERNFPALLEATRSNPQILSRIIERVAEFIQNNPETDSSSIQEIAQAEGNRQASALHQQVIYLMDVGVLSPMLGLFGTVVGILNSFGAIAGDSAVVAMRATVLAQGVSQALVATAVGLVVGITSMFFYSYFRGRVQGLISELETSATVLVSQIGLKIKK